MPQNIHMIPYKRSRKILNNISVSPKSLGVVHVYSMYIFYFHLHILVTFIRRLFLSTFQILLGKS